MDGTRRETACFRSPRCSEHTALVESTESNVALGKAALMEMSPACSVPPHLLPTSRGPVSVFDPHGGGLEAGGNQLLSCCH